MAVTYEGLEFKRLGHATVRIETSDGQVIYIDPWSEVIDGAPADADIVFSTHDDRDHYDPDAIEMVAKESTIVAAYDAIDTTDLAREIVVLPADDVTSVAGIEVRTVAAYNLPDGPHVRPSGEPYHPETTVVGLVLTIDGVEVYFCSDTDVLEPLADIDAAVVIPPIGGKYTMDRHEAAALVRAIDPSLVLPVHYNTPAVDGTEADADAFETDLEADGIRVELF
jgi:L-ascorbate metabolism protein UlaG (beta-lactamase superfamily)